LQIREAAFAIRRSIATRGLMRSFVHFARCTTAASGRSPLANQRHPFDAEHSLETSGLISGRELVSGHAHDLHSTAYYGIAPSIFKSAIARWAESIAGAELAFEQYTFVDLGAGKGRAILLASEYPFRAAVGVELNAGLAAMAERNARRWKELGRARCEIRVAKQDATEFVWPPAPLLVFLFNPFGRSVLAKVLQNLTQEADRTGQQVDMLYINPEFGFVADRFSGLKKLWSHRIEMSEADRAVDAFSSRSELCAAYRFQPAGSARRS
jgi:predicted RNA methylase